MQDVGDNPERQTPGIAVRSVGMKGKEKDRLVTTFEKGTGKVKKVG